MLRICTGCEDASTIALHRCNELGAAVFANVLGLEIARLSAPLKFSELERHTRDASCWGVKKML